MYNIDMYKNQLQELAQRSCFNLPSYECFREGLDHAPRFRASVNFNGEIFENLNYCSTLRQAEHAAAEVALNALSSNCPSMSITARVLDETGVYKNLLQETAHRAGLNLPVYTTVRSGPGHLPVFTCTVNIASMNFTGLSAKTKKQAEKNSAIAAWSALKRMPNLCSSSYQTNKETGTLEEDDQVVVSRVLSSFKVKEESKLLRWDQNRGRRRLVKGHKDNSFPSRPMDLFMDSSSQQQSSFLSPLPPPPPRTTSKILPLVRVTSEAKPEEMPPPLEEHQRDEEEWLGGKAGIIKNTIEKEGSRNSNSSVACYGTGSIYRLFPLFNSNSQDGQEPQIRSSLIGPPMAAPHIKRPIYTGGFNTHRIAPAVQIRSVIPVCAAPPPSNPPLILQEASPSSSTLADVGSPVPTQSGPNQESLISSKFNRLQL